MTASDKTPRRTLSGKRPGNYTGRCENGDEMSWREHNGHAHGADAAGPDADTRWLAAAGVLTIIPGALVIWFVRNYIARGFALGRV